MCQAQCQYTTGTETENTPALAAEERQLTTQTGRSVQTLLMGLTSDDHIYFQKLKQNQVYT